MSMRVNPCVLNNLIINEAENNSANWNDKRVTHESRSPCSKFYQQAVAKQQESIQEYELRKANFWAKEGQQIVEKMKNADSVQVNRAVEKAFEESEVQRRKFEFPEAGVSQMIGAGLHFARNPRLREEITTQFLEEFKQALINQLFQKDGLLDVFWGICFNKAYDGDRGLLEEFVDALVAKMFGKEAPEVIEKGPVNLVLEAVGRFEKLIAPFSHFMEGINEKLGFNPIPKERLEEGEPLQNKALGSMQINELAETVIMLLSGRIPNVVGSLDAFTESHEPDFKQTPIYDLAMANRRLMNDPQTKNKKGQKADLSQFKQDLSQYAGVRFAYEIVAGLSPEDTFYKDIFNKGKDLATLKSELFNSLESAHEHGNLSKVKLWMTKFLFYFIQPVCRVFVEPFLSNIEMQLRPMLDKPALKQTVKDLIDEFNDYLGNSVTLFQEVAKGNYPKDAGALDSILLKKVEDAAYPQAKGVIQEAVDRFAPEFIFASRLIQKLNILNIDETSALAILNPLLSVLKIFPLIFIFVFLYLPQTTMNIGMKWGIKRILMTKSRVLGGVVEELARASDRDLLIQCARLEAMQSMLLSIIGNMKNPAPSTNIAASPEEKQLDSMMSNFLLAIKYASAKDLGALQEIVKEGVEEPKNIFSYLEGKVNKIIDKETQKRAVEKVTETYRELFKDDFITEQVEEFLFMISKMFDPNFKTDEELKQEIAQLESTNAALIEELFNLAIGLVVEEQFDFTGKAQIERLQEVVSHFKGKVNEFINHANELINSENIEELNSFTRIFNQEVQKNISQINGLKLQYRDRYVTFANALDAWRNDKSSPNKKQDLQAALEGFEKWAKTISVSEGKKKRAPSEQINKLIGIFKAQMHYLAEDRVHKAENFLLKPYNIAGMTHMLLGMFAKKKFYFQKNR